MSRGPSSIHPRLNIQYIAEIAPAQIRGTLSTSYAWGIALGQLLAAVALQIVAVVSCVDHVRGGLEAELIHQTDSTNYKKAIYSEWVPLGSWVILFCFMPETPWFYVRRDNEVKAKQVMARIYRGVEGYDVDREYSVMAAEIERERQEKQEKGWEVITAYKDLFMGTNLVCSAFRQHHTSGHALTFRNVLSAGSLVSLLRSGPAAA